MGKAIKGGRRRLLRGWEHDQHTVATALRAVTPPSAEGESTILRQDPKVTNSARAMPGRKSHSRPPLGRLPLIAREHRGCLVRPLIARAGDGGKVLGPSRRILPLP